ncbi:MAG: zinc-binding dehydrogenase [Planctomycetes bacterium]|nr:zinc-binding dehydrogenase [Planctomycetota bacterium]
MTGPGAMEIRRYPYPASDRDSAVLRIEMCGVCGTDKHIFKGEATTIRGKSIFPYIGGHEIIGTVVEIGSNAATIKEYDHKPLRVGDRVAVAVEVNCGKCWYCRNQYNNITCENQVMAYGIHPGSEAPPHLRGGFAEYMYIAPGTSLFKVPESVPTDVAVFVEEMAVAYHALARAAQPFPAVKEGFGPGDSVAILGNGPLGILHGIMASIQGAGLRIATDLADRRLTKAKELYADVTINASRSPAAERVRRARDLTEGVGPDLVIESAGDPAVFLEALEMVRKGGTVIEVGNWVDTGQTVPLNVMQHIASKNVHIHSVFHCGANWGPVLRVMAKHAERYPFASLISHRMGLEELAADMAVVVNPDECMKVEVVPHRKRR